MKRLLLLEFSSPVTTFCMNMLTIFPENLWDTETVGGFVCVVCHTQLLVFVIVTELPAVISSRPHTVSVRFTVLRTLLY